MIRNSDSTPNAWENRLKSVMEEKQMNACRDRVFSWESRSLFDDLGPCEYAWIRQRSYEARECAFPGGYEELKRKVLSQVWTVWLRT